MNDDVRRTIYLTLTFFVLVVLAWVGIVFISSCGFSLSCNQAAPIVSRTPVPTLLPATMTAPETNADQVAEISEQGRCVVSSVDLVGAWVAAGSPEANAFSFTDLQGQTCEAKFAEVLPLFVEPNRFAEFSCASCHSADLTIARAQLDLSSHEGFVAGSRRTDASSKGTDILGAGEWESSLLYDFLVNAHENVKGHTVPAYDLIYHVGQIPAP